MVNQCGDLFPDLMRDSIICQLYAPTQMCWHLEPFELAICPIFILMMCHMILLFFNLIDAILLFS